jgi:16S rRNA (cytidine1402-2'-O)-methyltransferase
MSEVGPYIHLMTLPDGAVGRLVVCPTPIGNLRDVTLRVLDALRAADAIACEDTRRTRVLLDRYEITGTLVSYHEHNERERARELVARIQRGAVIALVCDAGMPLVSDPGWALLRGCLAADVHIEALPGPSSVLMAVVASGLPVERWRFVGFLPRKRAELERLLGASVETLVAFESPGRLPTTLELLASLDGERGVAVCRELTKLHEEIRRGSAVELATYYAQNPPRGEIVLVVEAATPESADREQAFTALRTLVDAGARPRSAARAIAKLTGVSANELYRELTGS